jgi:hypothetical protein
LSAKFTGHFSPIVPLSLLGVSRVVVGVGAPGGTSGNFQSRARTISLQAAVLPGPSRRRRIIILIEGNIEVLGRTETRCKELLDGSQVMEIERRSTRSHFVENWLWNGL